MVSKDISRNPSLLGTDDMGAITVYVAFPCKKLIRGTTSIFKLEGTKLLSHKAPFIGGPK